MAARGGTWLPTRPTTTPRATAVWRRRSAPRASSSILEIRGGKGDASAKVGAELHPLNYWVLDTGAAWMMTPHKDLLDDVCAAPINEVCSASGHVLKVAGAEQDAFEGAGL
ncbi:unnamed protein product [Closterium sp. NIES-54]